MYFELVGDNFDKLKEKTILTQFLIKNIQISEFFEKSVWFYVSQTCKQERL